MEHLECNWQRLWPFTIATGRRPPSASRSVLNLSVRFRFHAQALTDKLPRPQSPHPHAPPPRGTPPHHRIVASTALPSRNTKTGLSLHDRLRAPGLRAPGCALVINSADAFHRPRPVSTPWQRATGLSEAMLRERARPPLADLSHSAQPCRQREWPGRPRRGLRAYTSQRFLKRGSSSSTAAVAP